MINRVDAVQQSNNVINDTLSTKLVVFAILGLVGVVIINFMFFGQSRKVLKDRKYI